MAALSPKTLTELVYLSLALAAILLVLVGVLFLRLRAVRATYARLLGGGPAREDFLAATQRQIQRVDGLAGEIDVLGGEVARLGHRSALMVQGVGCVRYDAFPDMGGQLSFSAAFVNEAGDGVVLSTINGRSESRTYAKALHRATSQHNLSTEEQEAVSLAMRGAEPRPGASVASS